MITVFCDKNKLSYKEDYVFVYPTDDSVISQYCSYGHENSYIPSAGDIIVSYGKFYKVFSTVYDYDHRTVYVTVEEI